MGPETKQIGEPRAGSSAQAIEAPDSRIPICVVGLNFGQYIIKNELGTGSGAEFFRLAALCDIDEAKVNGLAASLGVRAYTSLDDVLLNPAIPAVGLYTGPSGRAELVRKIIRAGKDVMTTKPLETDPEAARAILTEAVELGRTVHLNSPAPILSPDIAQISQWQQHYNLGPLVACRADVWASYREEADGTWYDDPLRCPVAPIFRLGIYLINDLVALLGEAERVQVLASRLYTKRPTVDNAQLGIQFKSGALANIFASFCVGDGDQYRDSLVLNFEKGTIYRNAGPIRTEPFGDRSDLSLVMPSKETRRRVEAHVDTPASSAYRWDLFSRAIRGESLPGLVPISTAVNGLKIIRAMSEAERGDGTAFVR